MLRGWLGVAGVAGVARRRGNVREDPISRYRKFSGSKSGGRLEEAKVRGHFPNPERKGERRLAFMRGIKPGLHAMCQDPCLRRGVSHKAPSNVLSDTPAPRCPNPNHRSLSCAMLHPRITLVFPLHPRLLIIVRSRNTFSSPPETRNHCILKPRITPLALSLGWE
jgi:hypothetical protein